MAGTQGTEGLQFQPASTGYGPLLQRDYWAVIARCQLTPREVMAMVSDRFHELPPKAMLACRPAIDGRALRVGDEIMIRIRMAGDCAVRVIHRDACSLTLGTLEGHPEAGRITFGAYRDDDGEVVFHIRSRARSRSRAAYLAFVTGGDPMQTTTWTDFINNVALRCGDGVLGCIHSDMQRLPASALEEGDEAMDRPTFIARS